MNQQQLVLLQAALLLATAYFNAATVYNPLPVDVSGCNAEDFETGDGNCTLSCTISTSHPLHYVYSYFQYTVATNLSRAAVHGAVRTTLYSGDVTNYSISVQLFNYSAGYYVCSFQYLFLGGNFTQESEFAFRIANGTGRYINEKCDSASQCYALNAQCDGDDGHRVCNCNGLYNIPYSYNKTNAACLKHEDEGEECDIDEECEAPNEDYACIQYNSTTKTCTCRTNHIFVKKERRFMCLTQADFLGSCAYDEQCQTTPNTTCTSDGICFCKPGYSLQYPDVTTCYESPVVIKTNSCSPEDFYNGGNCTLSCYFDPPENESWRINSPQWTYRYTCDSNEIYIFDGVTDEYSMSLQLNGSYNAGYYFCKFNLQSGYIIDVWAFRISTSTNPSYSTNNCSMDGDCYTLYSQCQYDYTRSETECSCPTGYKSSSYSECYKYDSKNCNSDDECVNDNDMDYVYECVDHKCKCKYTMVYVAETNSTMCLQMKGYNSPCTYNEQCSADANSQCYYGKCQCLPDYDYTGYECTNNFEYVPVDASERKHGKWYKVDVAVSLFIILCVAVWSVFTIRKQYKHRNNCNSDVNLN